MLEMRQGKAADLRRQVDRAERMTETEVSDLRAEVKVSSVVEKCIDK